MPDPSGSSLPYNGWNFTTQRCSRCGGPRVARRFAAAGALLRRGDQVAGGPRAARRLVRVGSESTVPALEGIWYLLCCSSASPGRVPSYVGSEMVRDTVIPPWGAHVPESIGQFVALQRPELYYAEMLKCRRPSRNSSPWCQGPSGAEAALGSGRAPSESSARVAHCP